VASFCNLWLYIINIADYNLIASIFFGVIFGLRLPRAVSWQHGELLHLICEFGLTVGILPYFPGASVRPRAPALIKKWQNHDVVSPHRPLAEAPGLWFCLLLIPAQCRL